VLIDGFNEILRNGRGAMQYNRKSRNTTLYFSKNVEADFRIFAWLELEGAV